MLRSLQTTDIETIITTHAADRAAGHFNTFGRPLEEDEGLRLSLKSVISTGKRLVAGGKPLSSSVNVFEKDGVARGYCSLTAIKEDDHELFGTSSVRELYMASIFPSYRRQNFGNQMIDEWMDSLKGVPLLCARTYPNSQVMKNMLVKRGFKNLGQLKQEQTLLVFGSPEDVENVKRTFLRYGALK